MPAIAVVDYGMGNLRSVAKALAHVAPDEHIVVTADPRVIRAADRVVLPGQSAMPDCMRCLDASGLADVVQEAAATRPFLGICLGLQMLFQSSEEGPTPGLGVLPGRVVRFRDAAMQLPSGVRLKVPHMGWSPVRQARPIRSGPVSPTECGSISRTVITWFRKIARSSRELPTTDGVYLRHCTG
jgi:glutamine amidotransferase